MGTKRCLGGGGLGGLLVSGPLVLLLAVGGLLVVGLGLLVMRLGLLVVVFLLGSGVLVGLGSLCESTLGLDVVSTLR